MRSLSERLDNEGEIPKLREPRNLNEPSPHEAPFELDDATPLSQSLGDFLTEPAYAGKDANPDLVIQHVRNEELTAWISRYNTNEEPAYVLTCWGWDHRMHFEITKETAINVVEQASKSPIWLFDISDDGLLEELTGGL